MLSQVAAAGMELIFVAFGGALFGAIGMFLVTTYAWQARTTAREIRMTRYRKRIRDRFQRAHSHV